MKPSNLLLLLLSLIYLSGLLVTDRLLALQYVKIDLDDPYKNFQSLAVQPFKALRISGGNGYAIQVLQGKEYSVRLMNSRKDFFKMETVHDTLSIRFTVASQHYQQPESCTIGLIITVPRLAFLQLSGTNSEIGPFQQDSLTVLQDKNTNTRLKELHLGYVSLQGTGTSYFDLLRKNNARCLSLHLQNKAVVNFHQISFQQFRPVLQDSSAVVLYGRTLEIARHPVPSGDSGGLTTY